MLEFVINLAARARHYGGPDFGVFVQNAAELGAYPNYLGAITGIVGENLYLTDDGIKQDSQDISDGEDELKVFWNKGKPVLTVDYVGNPIDYTADGTVINDVYQSSRDAGFIPYVTVQSANELFVHPDHEPACVRNRPPKLFSPTWWRYLRIGIR